jgi:alkanesulfonate monooxygenase SsuD/methylene tetrahydromethanopterin reductase-like flavin-dependent oxidoreductase (luciferase family)
VREAEVLGFDTIWLTEHHFAADGYSPSILPLAAAIAATTEAWTQAAPSFHHLLTVYAQWANESADADKGGPKTVVPPVDELRHPPGPLMFRPAFGNPATVAEAINSTSARVRTTHLCLGVLPGMDPSRPAVRCTFT